MIIEPNVIIVGGVNLVLLAAAWGDLRRQVIHNREDTDRRHEENRETLGEIRDDMKLLNGKVHEHEAILRRIGE